MMSDGTDEDCTRKGERTIPSWEKGFPAEHLCQHATDAPHIDRTGVFFECQHHFGRAVPPRGNIFGHKCAAVVGNVGWGTGGACEAEVAELPCGTAMPSEVRR